MKVKHSIFMLIAGWAFHGCQSPVETSEHEQRPVVFGNLTAYSSFTDTLYVATSSPIDQPPEVTGAGVSGASATVVGAGDTVEYISLVSRPGRYLARTAKIVLPNETYQLNVFWADNQVWANTRVPDTVSIESVESGGWECGGRERVVPPIDLHRDDNTLEDIALARETGDFSHLSMDTVIYRDGSCYASSFASIPLFVIEWEARGEPGVVRAVTVALEDSVTQAIIDTSFVANAFKGPMYVDDEGNYYRPNPVVWNLSQTELHFGWLSFNYYGPHLIMIQATDSHFRDYFHGDAFQQNPYISPQGNIAGGYGLFSSVSSQFFLVYVAKDTAGDGRR